MKNYPTFPWWNAEPRPDLRLDSWNLLGTSGHVFDSPHAVIDSSSTPYQGMLHFWNQSAAGESPVRESTGKFVEICKETMNSFFPAEGSHPQNYMADQQRLQISELHVDKFTYSFNAFMLEDKIQNPSNCFSSPSEEMLWIKEVEMVDSVDDFKSSRSSQGCIDFPKLEMLDAEIASALNKIIQNSYFKKKVGLEEQKDQREDRFLRGRQIACMIHDYFRVTGAHHTVLDYADLFTIILRNDDVQEFDTRWDEISLSMTKISHLMTSWKVCTK